jgi:hypothetical protein
MPVRKNLSYRLRHNLSMAARELARHWEALLIGSDFGNRGKIYHHLVLIIATHFFFI